MADDAPLTPSDYNVWEVATPRQLLTLLQRLGITNQMIARHLGVKPPSISRWAHESRPMPARYRPRLVRFAREKLDEASELSAKAASLAPTDALRHAIHAEFAALYSRWKNQVLAEAGTVRRGMLQNHAILGEWLQRDPLTPEDVAAIEDFTGVIVAQARLLAGSVGQPAEGAGEATGREEPR
jgi:hypothetical protein